MEESERHRKKTRPGRSGQPEVDPSRAACDARLVRARKEKRVAQREALNETKEAYLAMEHDARAANKMAKTEAKLFPQLFTGFLKAMRRVADE